MLFLHFSATIVECFDSSSFRLILVGDGGVSTVKVVGRTTASRRRR